MREIKIIINEEDTGRVSINVDWGDWKSGTHKEKLMSIAIHEPMVKLLKTLPVGTLVGHAQGETMEEAKTICGLIADITEAAEEGEEDGK